MRILLIFGLLLICNLNYGQTRQRGEWIDFGSSHINKWLQIAPNKLGPNALPVADMDYAQLDSVSNFELGVHSHFMKGDNAVNSYLSFYWCVVPKKVVVKIWGNPTETFRTIDDVRDERQIYYDDTGWITDPGDLWISTFIQLLEGHPKWPDIVINYSTKTTTGGGATQGRYTDAPANYYYVAFGKSVFPKQGFINEVKIGMLGGFYVWQTNKVELAQDEGPLYEFGIELRHKSLSFKNEIGGYRGYDAYAYMGITGDNDPLIYRTNITKAGKIFDWKFEYQTGFHDYSYNTFRSSLIYRFKKEN